MWDTARERSKNELINDVLLGTPFHGRASVCRPTKSCQQQIYADSGDDLEDLLGAVDDKDE